MELDFSEVIELVNRTGMLQMNPEPVARDGGRWSLYTGTVRIGAMELIHNVLYLMPGLSRRTELAAGIAALELQDKGNGKGQIVYADVLVDDDRFPSLGRNDQTFGNYVRSGARQFFMSLAKQQLATYLNNIRQLDLRDYVDPSLATVANGHDVGTATNIRQAVLSPLRRPRRDPALSVLVAEPGQGKTYLCRYIAQTAAAMGFIPLLVTSDQWGSMAATDLQSPWKVIVNALQHFEAPIPWADGAEETFVRVAQKTGAFLLIFDAFDEYILRASGSVNATDVLQSFRELALSSSSQILLTSRTAFWESGADEVFSNFREENFAARCFEIKPFDREHAKVYFEQKLDRNATDVASALLLFNRIKNLQKASGVDLAGRGFLVYLIADIFLRTSHTNDSLINETGDAVHPLDWICWNFCMREDRRQSLGLDAATQLLFFEELAEDVVVENGASTNSVTLLLELIGNLDPEAARILAGTDEGQPGKLAYHPLLRRDKDGKWSFSQDQIHFLFLARRIISLVDAGQTAPLQNFLDRIRDLPQLHAEVAGMLLQLSVASGDGIVSLCKISSSLIALENNRSGQLDASCAASIATRLAVLATNELKTKADKRERTVFLIELSGGSGTIAGMQFPDTLVNFDFRGITFRRCRFENVTFIRCEFDVNTRFEACRITGAMLLKSPTLLKATFSPDCSVDAGLRRQLAVGDLEEGNRRYTHQDLRADFELVLQRLLPSDALPPARVTREQLERGRIVISPMRDVIFDAFQRNVFEQIPAAEMSGAEFHLRADVVPAARYHHTNGVFVGGIAVAWEEVRRLLQK